MKAISILSCTVWVLGVTVAFPQDLPLPSGPVLLTVDGDIARTNIGDTAQFDFDMLRAIGESAFETDTIWTTGTIRFEGVSLLDLLAHVGATGSMLDARALNDYSVQIPVEDAVEDGPILAYAVNGERLSVREKGPLWVVYPFAASRNYRTEVIYARSIWQLRAITVGP